MPRPRFLYELAALLAFGAVGCAPDANLPRGPVVLAPASMQESLSEVAEQWQMAGHLPATLSFAGTPTLARQLEAGAPADLVITADDAWMDWLAERHLLAPDTRTILASNTLVLVARIDPAKKVLRFDNPAQALREQAGLLALAEPEAVPAGRYAREALVALGLWEAVSMQIVPTENVRAALALVERGEAELGIVYASDAAASDKVYVAATFDRTLHSPIRYPAAIAANSANERAGEFLAFLAGEQGQSILREYGLAAPE